MPVIHITIQPEESGQKILQLLQRRVGRDVPRSALMRVIRKGQVRVDGRRVKPFDRVSAGQDVRIPPFATREQPASSLSDKSKSGLPVTFEDRDMLVLNKPAGLPVHPGTGWTDSVTTRLAALFPDAPFVPVPVHRLDKNTSGILLVAKTYTFLRFMQDQWQAGRVNKHYLAWVQGRWPYRERSRLTDDLAKSGRPGRERVRTGGGKRAVCEVVPAVVRPDLSLLKVRLLTGRTHQIRVQLASRGFPLVGDPKYGGPAHVSMLLHAWSLAWEGHCLTVLPSWTGRFRVDSEFLSADHLKG
ncbi:RluA family pseudouridine synthase [Desulfoplanes formicivorans]|uniref:Ribosomal large subunit pseudouridine synthase C n=1 Tax=Desulfoplanes formicivorans TaxID=1592317 RepID=A0A194AHQ4_9BACT|nr:RluA family pseudouridine synthase [Desulfoplanes formicivorans]GAU08853.1 pseudouridine synthase [Desulfoplanes formicivorans]